MRLRKTLVWSDPLEYASAMPNDEQAWAFLYSGLQNYFTGNNSYLALRVQETVIASDFDELEKKLSDDREQFDNAWFGYLGYGLKDFLENLPEDVPNAMGFPDLCMSKYNLILHFDHDKEVINIWSESEDDLPYVPSSQYVAENNDSLVVDLSSNMTRCEYLQHVETIKDAITRGDLYQANLTRKFSGNLLGTTRPIDIFTRLCKISPAPYSAFIKMGDKSIISSSPERFLHIDSDGCADTRPIKGSAARSDNLAEDLVLKETLAASEKDRAENLMIVDLCRNDLSRHCKTGSVKTEKLFEITSYATVHHMASTVIGQKRKTASTLDLIKGCFPPGSMTGAPKIKAMEICTQLEKLKRGVYSGSICWFGGDGSADSSVVIRTIIIDGNNLEFQVGGAIVHDSIPQDEFEETLTKAKAVSLALNIDLTKLASL